MFATLLQSKDAISIGNSPDRAINRARLWQRSLFWLAWLLPIGMSLGVYVFIWYWMILPGTTIEQLRQASNLLFFGALASFIVGLFVYQIQLILAQQVAASAELERKVEERTRHLLEVMLKLDEQNQALRVLDRQKSEFVTLVSHELRAPLTNINGGLELLLSRDQDLSPNTRSTLHLVGTEAGRLTHFVETILSVSAMEAGQLPVVPGPMLIEAVIATLRGQFANLPPGRLVTEVADRLPVVLADENFLQSVFFHLIDNALKYAPDGPIRLTVRALDDQVEVRVIDQGPGVSPEAASRLFNMFERLEAKDSQAVYGYGLGLYMCQRILKALNGDIVLESLPGQGATFVVRLPTWQEPLGEEETPQISV